MSPVGVAVMEPADGYLLHTNHFLDPDLAAGDRLVPIGDDTVPRMVRLQELRDALRAADPTTIARGLVSHWADGAPICAHPRPDADETDRWETKMMFSLDLARSALWLHEGGPCRVTDAGWKVVAA
jgi:isopenicillin-N N-acyltransferase-like protein